MSDSADKTVSDGFCKKCERVLQKDVRIDGIAVQCCGINYELKSNQLIIFQEGHEPDEQIVNYRNFDATSASRIVDFCKVCKEDTIHAIDLQSGVLRETRFCLSCF